MTLTPQFLDELRARTSLSALIGKTTKLQKAGREYRGCCPFHQEKTPSFYVNDDKGFYHCFGCSAHGDAIRWMTDQRGLPFIDAVKELAQTAGLDMPAQDRASTERAERAKGLHEAMADAAAWFTEQLNGLAGAEARAVLAKRGVSEATARAFGLGFAPDSRGKLRAALKDYGDAALVEAGLLIQVEDPTGPREPYDRFRGRLMIPIRDPRGRVIAFGGRVIGDGEPKYLNSPETPLFDKGRTLYNLDRAAPASRKTARVLVVEGYMDAIALAQAGIGEVVAPLGTALTEAQIERLWRMVDVPLVCLDGDAAGQKAALRAAHRALPMLAPGKSLAFVALPQGQDPDDLIRSEGVAAFELTVRHATPLADTLYTSLKSQAVVSSPEGRAGLRSSLQETAESIRDALVKKEYGKEFNNLFFEDFGWKKIERGVIGKAILHTSLTAKPHVFRSYVRSALYGLFRFPKVIPASIDMLTQLQLKDDDLRRWLDEVYSYGLRTEQLDYDGVQTIFETRAVGSKTASALKADLRFQWDLDVAVAVRRLEGLIDFLVSEKEIDDRLAELNAKLIADLKLDSYDVIEAERRLLRAQKLSLIEMGYNLGLDEPQQDTEAA